VYQKLGLCSLKRRRDVLHSLEQLPKVKKEFAGDIASGWFLGFMILTVVFRILAAAHTT
jgi:hypothetical protein